MKKPLLASLLFTALIGNALAAEYRHIPDWPKAPGPVLGNMHGDVAVSSAGEIYVSMMDPAAGMLVFHPDGRFLRRVPNAPNDFHGFLIRKEQDGEFIYGPRLVEQSIVKIKLTGEVVLEIPAAAIPDKFKELRPAPVQKQGEPVPPKDPNEGKPHVRFTGMAVASNGDLYVTDGYASSYIHRFDKQGRYLASYGGKAAPYGFKTLHKIAIDSRFTPERIIACDRENFRVVHLSLTGELLGVVATDLLRPSALAIHGDTLAIGELRGQVTLLDKAGKLITRVGTNSNTTEIGTNKTERDRWRPGIINAAHGVAFDAKGNLFVAEWTLFGRLHRFDRL